MEMKKDPALNSSINENSSNNNNYKKVNVDLKEEFIMNNSRRMESKKRKKYDICSSIYYFFCPCLRKVNLTDMRYVHLNDPDSNITEFKNEIKNRKYNIFTFLPVVLFNQFSFFGNQFYLLMTISQFFDELKVGFLFSYVAPLIFVLMVTLIKEGYDDVFRYKSDIETNSQQYTRIEASPNGKKKIKSSEIKIGDIIELEQNERVPADMVILKSLVGGSNSDGNLFIRTDQLDGETDWKLRKAPACTQSVPSIERLFDLRGFIQNDAPSKQIYDYKGVFNIFDSTNSTLKEPLSLENTMWANTILASKGAIGIVVYAGKETRAQMNTTLPRAKVCMLDLELNTLTKILFIIMVISSFIITALKGFNQNLGVTLITFFRFIVLLCAIIPIALRVNQDIAKAVNSMQINRDQNIPDTIARNSTIPEDLGRIDYIFSDKTGTLTKNEMIFKRIALETDQFNEESFEDLKMILQDECKHSNAPVLDLADILMNYESGTPSSFPSLNRSEDSMPQNYTSKRIRRNRGKVIRDAVSVMALCNNVTPVIDDDEDSKNEVKSENLNKNLNEKSDIEIEIESKNKDQEALDVNPNINSNSKNNNDNNPSKKQTVTYQASSPDEVALVKFAESMNMKLIHRTDREVKIKNADGYIEEYETLAIFPFSSETKRMGILIRNKTYNHIIFYMKGAENVMETFVKEEYKAYIRENAENLACVGLRTLVLTQKLISEEFYQQWKKEYNEALTSMDDRKAKVTRVISKLENNMDFLCVTGVEDLLQDEVDTTIENLRNAGIKIWMLTGDKVETATCISISAGLKSKFQKIFTIKYDNMKDLEDDADIFNSINISKNNTRGVYGSTPSERIKNELDKYQYLEKNSHILIIDGDSLEIALSNFEKHFFETAMNAPAVVACRCSPTQKSRIVKTMKIYANKKRTCAIGDGGNDVAMILESDVGIGIVGKEGLQASLAADYSITKFKHLNLLILWFGRLSYKNTSTISKFVIHRGLIISLIQFIFSIMFYCSAVPIYNGILILGYSTVYTNFPVFALLVDRDTDVNYVMKFPGLYKKLLKGRELSIKNFMWWFWKSLFQASVIMFGSIALFGDNVYLKIATITFTALIIAELLNVYTEIKTFHRYMWISLFGTLLVYLFSLIFLKEILDVYYIFDITTMSKIMLITVASWLPFYLSERVREYCFPEAHEKLNLMEQ